MSGTPAPPERDWSDYLIEASAIASIVRHAVQNGASVEDVEMIIAKRLVRAYGEPWDDPDYDPDPRGKVL